ncbi:acetamidase [Moniliophthora roreri]|nr:acetamidase [Moniliophthora roreri]
MSGAKYQEICAEAHQYRVKQLEPLPDICSRPLTPEEERIYSLSCPDLVQELSTGSLQKDDVKRVYAKKIVEAQRRCNCVSDVLFTDDALHGYGVDVGDGSLRGVPISIKDTIDVENHATTISYASNARYDPESLSEKQNAPLVSLILRSSPFLMVKSTVPTGLFSINTSSPLMSGPTLNPHNPLYGVGASTGGGGVLAAFGAVKAELGSDVAGSIRLPAHFTGCYALKGSAERFPAWANRSSMAGMVGGVRTVGGVLSPTFEDLNYFYRAIIQMKPWELDSTCLPIPWCDSEYQAVLRRGNVEQHDGSNNPQLPERGRKLKFGVIWTDGIVPPSPACRRGLAMTVDALRADGHEVVDLTSHAPSLSKVLNIGYNLGFGDACQQITSQVMPGEGLNAALGDIIDLVRIPPWFRHVLSWWIRFADIIGLAPNPVRDAEQAAAKAGSFKSSNWLGGLFRFTHSLATFPFRLVRTLHTSFSPSRYSRISSSSFWLPQLSLLEVLRPQSVISQRGLIHQLDVLRQEWKEDVWERHRIDFILTVGAPMPAVREEFDVDPSCVGGASGKSVQVKMDPYRRTHPLAQDEPEYNWAKKHSANLINRRKGDKEDAQRLGLISAGYVFTWNLLDYPAGILPVTTVDRDLDALYPPYPDTLPASSSAAAYDPNDADAPAVYKRRLPESIYERYQSNTPGLPSSLTPLAKDDGGYMSEWERTGPYSNSGKGPKYVSGHANGNGHANGDRNVKNGHPNGNGHANGHEYANGHGHGNGHGHHIPHNCVASTPYWAQSSLSHMTYSVYHSPSQHGLPVGIQVVGQRMQEEKVLGGMKVIQNALTKMGWGYQYHPKARGF